MTSGGGRDDIIYRPWIPSFYLSLYPPKCDSNYTIPTETQHTRSKLSLHYAPNNPEYLHHSWPSNTCNRALCPTTSTSNNISRVSDQKTLAISSNAPNPYPIKGDHGVADICLLRVNFILTPMLLYLTSTTANLLMLTETV